MPRAVAYLYVPEGMADGEPTLVMAELASGRFFRPGAPGLVTRVCTVSGWPARSMGGLTIRSAFPRATCRVGRSGVLSGMVPYPPEE